MWVRGGWSGAGVFGEKRESWDRTGPPSIRGSGGGRGAAEWGKVVRQRGFGVAEKRRPWCIH
ncbi:hypothetical protein TPA0910_15360 [Streptomyces hygroscopicus subsp. sporocinereus]|uniref:Uncharacterized protein n=1 Tax=Streptomyces hygroscopicus TaxID=1912 RepID=A0ABQ3TUY7_STRHY|nr:hypothetical protein TPA0910_15360 [Streptomyces hygroscopicus]